MNRNLTKYYKKSGSVTQYNWKELSKLRTVQDHLQMPRLDEKMELTKDKIFMNLEIKDKVFPEIVKLIEKYDYFWPDIFIISLS